MAIKAVHLELLSVLTTGRFFAAFRRFIAKRDIPTHVYSDNRINFVGANNHLKELYVLFNSDKYRDRINRFLIDHRISWHFIFSFHSTFRRFMGIYGKIIFKHYFKRVVGELLFTFEELNIFAVEIEGILDSRPISYLSSDLSDILVLFLSRYLIGKPLINLPEPDFSSVPATRLSIGEHIIKVR